MTYTTTCFREITDNYDVPARSPTALEIYVLACLVFVCAGIFEYAFILYKTKFKKKEWIPDTEDEGGHSPTIPDGEGNSPSQGTKDDGGAGANAQSEAKEPPKSPEAIEEKLRKAFDTNNIDIVSGILFPFLFLIFNLVYWIHYLA